MADLNYLNDVEKQIIDSVRNLRFGSVEITVHDSKIVQLIKSDKTRFDRMPRD